MQEHEGSHHGTPEDAPQCTKKEDLGPVGPSVPQPLRVSTLPGRANTAPPPEGGPNGSSRPPGIGDAGGLPPPDPPLGVWGGAPRIIYYEGLGGEREHPREKLKTQTLD